jgi:hypothetical protein
MPDGLATIMLERDDELKLLGFLATLAALLGIVVSVSQLQVSQVTPKLVIAYFSIDNDYAFWPMGIILGIVFYFAIQRLHRQVKWRSLTHP